MYQAHDAQPVLRGRARPPLCRCQPPHR